MAVWRLTEAVKWLETELRRGDVYARDMFQLLDDTWCHYAHGDERGTYTIAEPGMAESHMEWLEAQTLLQCRGGAYLMGPGSEHDVRFWMETGYQPKFHDFDERVCLIKGHSDGA